MKIGVIRNLSLVGEHRPRKLCQALGVARSADYASQEKPARPQARENKVLRERIGQKIVQAAGARLLCQPPYSADFNHIELAWSKLKN